MEGGATGMSSLITALTSGFEQMATDALSAIGAVVPVVLPILAAVMVVGITIAVAKKASGNGNR